MWVVVPRSEPIADDRLAEFRQEPSLWGAFSEVLLMIANIGTAVALFPILGRLFPGLSVGLRDDTISDSVFIAVRDLSILLIVTLRQDFAGSGEPDGAALATVGQAFVTLQKWTFQLGRASSSASGTGSCSATR